MGSTSPSVWSHVRSSRLRSRTLLGCDALRELVRVAAGPAAMAGRRRHRAGPPQRVVFRIAVVATFHALGRAPIARDAARRAGFVSVYLTVAEVLD